MSCHAFRDPYSRLLLQLSAAFGGGHPWMAWSQIDENILSRFGARVDTAIYSTGGVNGILTQLEFRGLLNVRTMAPETYAQPTAALYTTVNTLYVLESLHTTLPSTHS